MYVRTHANQEALCMYVRFTNNFLIYNVACRGYLVCLSRGNMPCGAAEGAYAGTSWEADLATLKDLC